MPRPPIDLLRALLDEARARLPALEAELAALVARVREGKHDARRVHDAGLALEEIARTKLYRIGGHRTLAALLDAEVGISRTTAHRWRAIARALAPEQAEDLGVRAGYDRVRPRPEKAEPRITRRDRERIDLAKRFLRRRGIRDARLELVVRGGERLLRIDLPVADADRLR